MEYSSSLHADFRTAPRQDSRQQHTMSTLTMAAPSPYHSFKNDLHWNISRTAPDAFIQRIESRHIALPSIRQTFPDLHLEGSLANVATSRPSSSSYKASPPSSAGFQILSGYVHSPNANKRRFSDQYEQESPRVKQVPRLYHSPEAAQRRTVYPHRDQPALNPRDSWAENPQYGEAVSAWPPSLEVNGRFEPRSGLSSLSPTLQFDRGAPAMSNPREYMAESSNVPSSRTSESEHGIQVVVDRPSIQSRNQDYGCSYQHPSQYQSPSTSSAVGRFDRTPFSAGSTFGCHYQDMGRYVDISIGGDCKQRKRRGNLPKETTDKLRAWFVAHLQHPYPTEDEKQDLMRQTGLQMNQISNWFINARRRQLPTMISNARAESDAMITRSHGGRNSGHESVLKSVEHTSEYGGRCDDGRPLSDSEGGAYRDDIHPLRQRRDVNLKRESV